MNEYLQPQLLYRTRGFSNLELCALEVKTISELGTRVTIRVKAPPRQCRVGKNGQINTAVTCDASKKIGRGTSSEQYIY